MNTFSKIDFPNEKIIFKNHIISDLSELYSMENFHDVLRATDINQQISVTTQKNRQYWQQRNEAVSLISSNIVSNGLFSFLWGGSWNVWQIWIFVCCAYTTIYILARLFLPLGLMDAMANYNLLTPGNALMKRLQKSPVQGIFYKK
jgi:hypothetical protein